MRATARVEIPASRETVWRTVTDIENAAKTIQAIEKIEVLERPKDSLVGLKWRETRTMFGKTATEVMWITEAAAPSHYVTRAESHGSVYTSHISLADDAGITVLTMHFAGDPQTFGAKLMWATMGWMFKSATRKAMQKDLEDIRSAVEARPR